MYIQVDTLLYSESDFIHCFKLKGRSPIVTTTTTKFRDVEIRAPRGTKLNTKSWLTEAPLRMLMNNLDPDVAENPKELVVYGGIGRAARNWECFDKIVETLKNLEIDETLLVQSGKPLVYLKLIKMHHVY